MSQRQKIRIDFLIHRSLKNSQQFNGTSRKRPPPVSDHLGLKFWVVAYWRFDCISVYTVLLVSYCTTNTRGFLLDAVTSNLDGKLNESIYCFCRIFASLGSTTAPQTCLFLRTIHPAVEIANRYTME